MIEFERLPPVLGLAELIDAIHARVAAACHIPLEALFADSPRNLALARIPRNPRAFLARCGCCRYPKRIDLDPERPVPVFGAPHWFCRNCDVWQHACPPEHGEVVTGSEEWG